MKKISTFAVLLILILQGCQRAADGDYCFHILSTNDVHGTYFDTDYVDGSLKNSLMAVNSYVDSIRNAEGKDNVILLDAGDFLQGDNAAYYFNYVDSVAGHIYPRIAEYMGYDAIIGGNHDIETGHDVYDALAEDLTNKGIPFLAGNAIRNDNGKPYFPSYTVIKRNGVKIAVLGYDNANIKAWLNESLWSGMHFESLTDIVQKDVDMVTKKVKPHIVIVAVHSGTGDGNGKQLENQGLDLYNSLKGVDMVFCAHDHKAYVTDDGETCLINTGSHSRNLGHGTINVSLKKGKAVAKSVNAELIPIDATKSDPAMREFFQKDYETVKEFTLRKVGELKEDLNLSDALNGMSDYINLIHLICLNSSDAKLSIVAPLATRGTIKAGTLVYNDLFKLYQYENQLFKVKFTGKEIKDYLEVSYDGWINADVPTYNYDSMAGLFYTVDKTKPFGSRIEISGLADGSAFDENATYEVAMTSYRASGGGGLMGKVGIDTDNIEERVTGKYPEIRELLYDYIQEVRDIDPDVLNTSPLLGGWKFIPEEN